MSASALSKRSKSEILKSPLQQCAMVIFPISNKRTFVRLIRVVTATKTPLIAADAPTIKRFEFKI
jgi:hypothetical protein